jgi:hypothetical protein
MVLVGSLASMASAAGETTRVHIGAEVDAHWRGAYDILVRPKGARLFLEQTAGVVEPNFLDFGGQGGISADQLAAIRALPGVEVAAPVGFVGFVRADASTPIVELPSPPAQPTLYRLTFTLIVSDGIADHLVQRETDRILYGRGTRDEVASDMPLSLRVDGSTVVGGQLAANASLPALGSPILAVDPGAERELLGPSAVFLDALASVANAGRTVGTFGHQRIPDIFLFAQRYLRDAELVQTDEGYTPEQVRLRRSRPVVPLLVSSTVYTALHLTVAVSQVGRPLAGFPGGTDDVSRLAVAEREAGPGVTPIGTSVLDVGGALRPLQVAELMMPWPGITVPPEEGHFYAIEPAQQYSSRLIDRPAYEAVPARPDGAALSFRIVPQGKSDPWKERLVPGQDLPPRLAPELGAEPLYRQTDDFPVAVLEGFVPQGADDQPFYFAPLGEFDLSTLHLPTDPLSYVPFGAYDPPDTALVADPAGVVVEARQVKPLTEPAGLLTLPPLAITDIAGAEALRGPAPIDAVRVRVAGVTDFSPASRARIDAVASAIAALGLDVDEVAGSSPQPVEVYVPAYHVEDDPPSDLGWVRQGWTTLGAAERVETTLAGATAALLALAVLAAAVVAAGLQLFAISGRRREIAMLRASGWRRGQVAMWLLGEALVAAGVVALLAAAGWTIGGQSPAAAAAGASIVLVYLVSALGASMAAFRRAGTQPVSSIYGGDVWSGAPRAGTLGVRGPLSYALRGLLARPARTLALVGGVAVCATALGVGAARLSTIAEEAGPTRLAAAITTGVAPFQFGLVALTGLVGIAFTLAVGRLDASERAGDEFVLRSAGWGRSHLSRAHWAAALMAGVAAAGAAVLLVWLLDRLAPELPVAVMLGVAAAVCPILGLGVVVATRAARVRPAGPL